MTKIVKNDTNCAFFKVERLLKSDLKSVLEIENLSFSHPWSQNLFEEELSNNSSICLKTSSSDNKIVGYILLRNIVDETHLLNIALHPDYRKKGLAKKMIETYEKKFCSGKLILLEVRVSNKPALELYKKLGFKQLYVRKRYYPDGEDAIVMEKKTCATAE